MKYKLSYIPLIWITTALVGSILYFVTSYFLSGTAVFGGTLGGLIQVYFLTIGIAMLFSLPAVLIFWLTMAYLIKTKLSTTNIKDILASVAMCLIFLIFILFRATSYALMFTVPCYIIPLVGGVYFFKLR